jgi:Asp-tRNA(Asn)/Glu-tRNA(Gln) amidotransferase C subunit
MTEKTELKKEVFLSMAKAFGLDINDPHIEELYAYVQKILPTLKRIEELDLTDMEPVMPFTPLDSKTSYGVYDGDMEKKCSSL